MGETVIDTGSFSRSGKEEKEESDTSTELPAAQALKHKHSNVIMITIYFFMLLHSFGFFAEVSHPRNQKIQAYDTNEKRGDDPLLPNGREKSPT